MTGARRRHGFDTILISLSILLRSTTEIPERYDRRLAHTFLSSNPEDRPDPFRGLRHGLDAKFGKPASSMTVGVGSPKTEREAGTDPTKARPSTIRTRGTAGPSAAWICRTDATRRKLRSAISVCSTPRRQMVPSSAFLNLTPSINACAAALRAGRFEPSPKSKLRTGTLGHGKLRPKPVGLSLAVPMLRSCAKCDQNHTRRRFLARCLPQ